MATNREVIREARRLLSANAQSERALRTVRHALFREMLESNHCEQELVREYRL